jgi:beta-lactam-binding protein with PASTA domain
MPSAQLKGKTLATAKAALTDAHCALGKVTKKKSSRKPGIVLSQNPKPATILTIGSKVAVVVSKPR